MEQFTWYVVRTTGITAYVLLFATVATGLILSGPGGAWWKGMPINPLHRFIPWLMGAFLAIHVLTLLANSFLHFGVLEILVPFVAIYEPFWTGMGVLAVYLIAVVAVTTAVRRRLHNLIWYGLHLLSYPAFVLATAHGIKTGSDTRKLWVEAVYILCAGIATFLVAVRFTRLSAAGDDRLHRWGPGVIAGSAFSAMVVLLLATRLQR